LRRKVASRVGQVCLPEGGYYLVGGRLQEVAPERMVPTEEVLPGVYVPLLIIPNISSSFWDEDHARFEVHDSRLMGPDRRPLRHCYLQYMPRPVHTRKNSFFDAVEIPEDDHKAFQTVLLGAARYVTRHGVDISGGKPIVRELTQNNRVEIHRRGWIRMQRDTRWSTGYYIARYAIANGLEAVRETEEVARFLEADDDQTRRYASFDVLRKAVASVLDSFEPVYEIARSQGSIRRPEPTATRFVTQYFDRRQPDYIPVLVDGLLAA
jgi:hypothetical protein